MMFTDNETEYLMSRNLGRIATVSSDQQPHVVPIIYEFDGRCFYFTGADLEDSLMFRNIQQNNKVALVVDDFENGEAWSARGITVRGIAEVLRKDGYTYVRVSPLTKRSWGL